ncbi:MULTISPECIES: electron transport complex subunit RsxB [Thiomicrorhabdus]|uniref:Ion-translocating oxidoreductase complex subunit B n=1 Tax=Thiomicrorhabdus xiamenensis TaxID=2739063 RepID=A0A7D4SN15_9GAMM|nr:MULTISPECIES: electron transport complex subunit RsxB [Thiomicrorhabdus]MBO1924052.1 electron transport complex subunit RsxB [Thiomicrorhabdus sp. 6S3-12]QKI89061.1 electron transport complex subunit RsxB [Thiomicrorhabdus xiamenensis]
MDWIHGLEALGIFLALALLFGLALGYAAVRFKVEGNPMADQIDKELPQTQCGQCGFPGCRPYAEALANGESEVNLCVPGGTEVMIKISEITGREQKAMEDTSADEKAKETAFIDEDLCIGCVLCIKECPVDAILGATKMMHTVIQQECTGCELCVPVCPVDCIEMRPQEVNLKNWQWPAPNEPKSALPNDSKPLANLLQENS